MKGLNKSYRDTRKSQQDRTANSLDAMTKLAALKEAGYDVQGQPGLFGGGQTLVSNPQPLPQGFVKVGGKVMEDPTYYNPGKEREKAAIRAEEFSNSMKALQQLQGTSGITPGTTMRIPGGITTPLNPKLTGDEASAVAANEVFTPLAEGLKEDTKGGVFNSKFGNVGRTFRQYAVGQPNAMLTSYDSKLQDTQGKVNSIRRYVFGEGGKQLTPYEANIVNALIKPTGKSDQQYEKDLDEATKLIESKARLATGGSNAVRFGEGSESNEPSEEDIQYTMEKYGLSREEVLKQLNA